MSFATSCSMPMLWEFQTMGVSQSMVAGTVVFQTPTPAETHNLFGTNGSKTVPPIDMYCSVVASQGISVALSWVLKVQPLQVAPPLRLSCRKPPGETTTMWLALKGSTAMVSNPCELSRFKCVQAPFE